LKRLKIVLGLVVFGLLMVFAVSNDHAVYINFGKGHPLPLLGSEYPPGTPDPPPPDAEKVPRPIPVYLLVFLCFGAGFVVSWAMGTAERLQMKRVLKQKVQEIRELNKEIDELHAGMATSGGGAGGGVEPGEAEEAPAGGDAGL
jgi:uncharacterized integral membrane protein